MTRGRKPIEVNSAELQKVITELEQKQPDGKFPNRSQLWLALEATEWAKSRNPRPLTSQVAMTLAKKGSLTIVTPVGQRGKLSGVPVPKGGKKKKSIPLTVIDALKKAVPEKYHKVVNRAMNGSLKAKVKLKCLDCTNYQPVEVRECPVIDCSLWTARPFRSKTNADSVGTVL